MAKGKYWNANGIPGCVLVGGTQGARVTLMFAPQAGLTANHGQWIRVCETHKMAAPLQGQREARDTVRKSADWCSDCANKELPKCYPLADLRVGAPPPPPKAGLVLNQMPNRQPQIAKPQGPRRLPKGIGRCPSCMSTIPIEDMYANSHGKLRCPACNDLPDPNTLSVAELGEVVLAIRATWTCSHQHIWVGKNGECTFCTGGWKKPHRHDKRAARELAVAEA